MAIITLSREMGSGGKTIARQVADELKYNCADKELIVDVARELGVSESSVKQFDEREKGTQGIRQWLRDLMNSDDPVFTSAAAPGFWPMLADPGLGQGERTYQGGEHILNREEYMEILKRIIFRIKERGNTIIIGRGSQCLLAGAPDVLHVRVVAPLELRCERIMARDGVTLSEAKHRVLSSDRTRSAYLKERYYIDWTDPMLYHLVINSGLCPRDKAVGIIVDAANNL